MADKPGRNPQKKPKDRKQGMALPDAVLQAMPRYPLGSAFHDSLPEALKPHFERWDAHTSVR